MSSGSSSPRRSPRTQAERRVETRAALLEATIDCLVDHGYAKTTTGRIAELAGVSRGAYTPYFRTRSELLATAIAHLAEQQADAIRAEFASREVTLVEALDALWSASQDRSFDAALELWVASRSDPDLRAQMQQAERRILRTITTVAETALGEWAQRPGFGDDLLHMLATIRGILLMRISHGGSSRGAEQVWRSTRERLVRSFA